MGILVFYRMRALSQAKALTESAHSKTAIMRHILRGAMPCGPPLVGSDELS